MPAVTNIAAYRFAPLRDLKPLRDRLAAQCKGWGLKGTILLSTEGINLFLAGEAEAIGRLVAELRAIEGLGGLAPKYSESEHQPFNRMVVRIKQEIIAFGVEGIDPARRTSPKLPARTLKQWLDEGRPVTLLDTRNDYEVKLGTFRGAQALGIRHFRQFPAASRQLPETLKEQPVVMFCTGGIRCEKAGPFLEREGFRSIFQLDGGILKYFEECGGEHYEGECFVFDQRVGVDPALRETDSAQCFACQASLDAEDQGDPRYVAGVSCPYCHRSDAERQAETQTRRNEAIRAATTPLPGSTARENRRPLNVPASADGLALLDFLCAIFAHTARGEWRAQCEAGRFTDAAGCPLHADARLRAGERCFHVEPDAIEPDVDAGIRIVHEDDALVVLEKPAPLPMHPCGRFNRNTLQSILNVVYAPQKLRPAHRLDANTTGLVACARTRHFARLLHGQFAAGAVRKIYLAEVAGHPAEGALVCDAPVADEASAFGSRRIDAENGRPARTEFRILARHADGTALVEAHPLTGRTNQIRLHLWQLGFPILGDPAYLAGSRFGESLTLPLGAPPMRLHAAELEFVHPLTREAVFFRATPPSWQRGSA